MSRWMKWGAGLLLLALGFLRQRNEHRIDAWKARVRQRRRWMLGGIALFLGAAAVLGALTVLAGIPSLKASAGHWAITAWFLEFAMERSVDTHSLDVKVPVSVEDERLVLMGAGHYEHGCRFCHGIPGEPRPSVPMAMTPHPPRLSETVPEFDDAELYYIVRHGVKFTGMPAWPSQQREDEVWAVVAFLRRLPELDTEGYRRLVFGEQQENTQAPEIVTEVCGRCHGVDGLGRGLGAFPKLAGQQPAYLRRSLLAYKEGTRYSGIMEPIAVGLDEREIEDIVQWYSNLAPPGPVAAPATGLGAQIATRGIPERRIPACAHCHGPGHPPRYPVYPRLAGQYADYLEQQLWLFHLGRRGGTEFRHVMQSVVAHQLEAHEIREVAAYYASLGD